MVLFLSAMASMLKKKLSLATAKSISSLEIAGDLIGVNKASLNFVLMSLKEETTNMALVSSSSTLPGLLLE